jgi:ABC-type Fe3+/spermidine/putrescine transport system ATPase subunit
VADFIGRVNLLPVKLVDSQTGKLTVNFLDNTLQITSFAGTAPEMLLAVRPEVIQLQPEANWNGPVCQGRLTKSVYVGQHMEYTVCLDAGIEITALTYGRRLNVGAGDPVRVGFDPDTLHGVTA